jgi:hypothetical protein
MKTPVIDRMVNIALEAPFSGLTPGTLFEHFPTSTVLNVVI